MNVNTLARRMVAVAAAGALVAVPLTTASTANAAGVLNSGFEQPFAGVKKYLPLSPKEATLGRQVNMPLGQAKADALAAAFGFDKDKAFSDRQFRKFVTGRGKGKWTAAERAKAAELVDISTSYLTNTTANPIYRTIDGVRTEVVLGSYGLIVDGDGMLRVPANCPDPASADFADCSPVRQINWVLAPDAICEYPDLAKTPPAGVPCGYMGAWMRKNKAKDTLKELYSSAYVREAPFASKSQDAAGIPQLINNTKSGGATVQVGVPVAPAMWITNYLLVYALNPQKAAQFPAYWAAIPDEVAAALADAERYPNGQVPYADYMSAFGK